MWNWNWRHFLWVKGFPKVVFDWFLRNTGKKYWPRSSNKWQWLLFAIISTTVPTTGAWILPEIRGYHVMIHICHIVLQFFGKWLAKIDPRNTTRHDSIQHSVCGWFTLKTRQVALFGLLSLGGSWWATRTSGYHPFSSLTPLSSAKSFAIICVSGLLQTQSQKLDCSNITSALICNIPQDWAPKSTGTPRLRSWFTHLGTYPI